MANIRDVSRVSGLSVGTVSRFLNGYKIKDANQRKIEEAIQKLGFKQNYLARGLRSRKTRTVGIILPDLTDAFPTRLVSLTENNLYHHGYSTIICDYNRDVNQMNTKLDFLIHRMIDALVIFPMNGNISPDVLRQISEERIPIVIVNEDIPDAVADRVFIDNNGGSLLATRFLIENNHTRIGIINGFKESSVARSRYNGFVEAMEEWNIPVNEEYVYWSDFTISGGHDSAMDILSLPNPPTALLITNYFLTMGSILAIYEKNLRLPTYLSVIGFGYFEMSDIIRPAITSINQPMEEMGKQISNIILKRLAGDTSEKQTVIITPELIINESVRAL